MAKSAADLKKFGCEIISDPGVVPIKFRAPGGTVAGIVTARYKKARGQSLADTHDSLVAKTSDGLHHFMYNFFLVVFRQTNLSGMNCRQRSRE